MSIACDVPNLVFWLGLATKTAVTAALVVFAACATERAGPRIGALVATLPVSAAPAYAFVALDHDAAFLAASALASLTINAANLVFCIVYTVIAQRRGLALSLSAALGSWVALAVALRSIEWSLSSAILLNIAVYLLSVPIGRRFRHAPMPPASRRWYDLPMRAGMVAALVAAIVVLSSRVGPAVTGTLALFPIVLTSLILIFHTRVGGAATAVLTANGISGLAGYGVALLVLHTALTAVAAPTALSLALALAVALAWNAIILGFRPSGGAAIQPSMSQDTRLAPRPKRADLPS